MDPERWKRVQELFNAAVELDPARRTAFLDESCPDDPELRREVESLIASTPAEDDFIELARTSDGFIGERHVGWATSTGMGWTI